MKTDVCVTTADIALIYEKICLYVGLYLKVEGTLVQVKSQTSAPQVSSNSIHTACFTQPVHIFKGIWAGPRYCLPSL